MPNIRCQLTLAYQRDVTIMEKQWETFYRWEWFRREQWRPHFREVKADKWGGSCGAFKKVLDEINGKFALDSSCGLGLKTIVMKEMGIDIVGCDGCAYAIEMARELSRIEGHNIEFFASRWSELPSITNYEFDGIFNDALSWILTREEFEASLQGFLSVLKPSGVLVFFGAEKDSPSDSESQKKLFEQFWQERPRFSIEWTYEAMGTRCTSILIREKGDMFVDEHHIFLIQENDTQRIESATIRQPVYWSWSLLKEMFLKAGFSKLETQTFRGMGRGGTTLKLNVATK